MSMQIRTDPSVQSQTLQANCRKVLTGVNLLVRASNALTLMKLRSNIADAFVQKNKTWAAFTYAGELSTAAWGWNSQGVCFTLNAVYAKFVNTYGVGRNFVSRSILDAENLEDAVRRITIPGQATGHNINVIGLDEKQIVTIETGGAQLM